MDDPPAPDAADLLRQAEAAERRAAASYNTVEYAEHLDAARRLRLLASALADEAATADASR